MVAVPCASAAAKGRLTTFAPESPSHGGRSGSVHQYQVLSTVG
jgi:hypothetical protein